MKCKSRQASREADRQVDRQINRHTDRQMHRQTKKQAGRQKKPTDKQKAERQIKRQADKQTQIKKSGSYINLTCEYKWLTVVLTGNFSAYVTAVKRFRNKDVRPSQNGRAAIFAKLFIKTY